MLGGHLPYEETAWVTDRQRRAYETRGEIDRQAYATEIIEGRIQRGRMVFYDTLPPWVPGSLRSIIRKCLKGGSGRAVATAADLIAKVNSIRGGIADWRILGGVPVLRRERRAFRIIEDRGSFRIEKMLNGAIAWRRERALTPRDLADAVQMAERL